MRLCADCGKQDGYWFEDKPCSCGADKFVDNPGDPTQHKPDCHSLGHEVVLYPVRLNREEVDIPNKQIASSYYRQRGWRLMQNGAKFYRVKMLCRGCTVKANEALQVRADYEKACKAARGGQSMTYAQMLASQ